MRFSTVFPIAASCLAMNVVLIVGSAVSFARNTSSRDCVSFAEAREHVGASACVTGTVQHVEDGRNGAKILNFCHDRQKMCPFTVVVFPADLKKMGDIVQLEGRQIEIKGTIQDHGGHTEIILRRSQQLGEGAFLLFPTVPTDYDVERAGHYSAGKFKRPKAAKKKHTQKGDPISIEDPEEPQ